MILVRLLSKFSFPVLYGLAAMIYFLSYHVFRYRRRMVRKNLYRSFPNEENSKLKEIEKKFYKRFSYYVVETIKVLSLTEEEITTRVTPINSEEYVNDLKSGQPVIALASHQFNWEWALLAAKAHYDFPIQAVYQRINTPAFDRLMFDIRSSFGVQPIEKDKLLTIVRDTGHSRVIAFVADQSPHRKIKKPYWTTFLSQETAFFPSTDFLPKLTGYPVYFIKSKFTEKGHYTLEWVKLGNPPYEKDSSLVIDRYIEEVEKLIQEEPEGWLWTHNRWKLKKPQP